MEVSKLTAVENEIRKVIPRLMELREGCKLELPIYNSKNELIETIKSSIGQDFHIISENEIGYAGYYYEDIDFDVIGHDVMLNDVLEWNELERGLTIITMWNLSTPYLKDQSEELIDFLFNLIEK